MLKQVKVIIAGSRDFDDYEMMVGRMLQVERALHDNKQEMAEVVSGHAKGADKLGETWAWFNNIPVKLFPADWQHKGKAAGIVRNRQMAEYADVLVLFWDGKSRGSLNMLQTARELGLDTHVIRYKEKES